MPPPSLGTLTRSRGRNILPTERALNFLSFFLSFYPSMRLKMRQVAASTMIATATALILAIAPTWDAAGQSSCNGPPAGTPAQERACAEQGTRMWEIQGKKYELVFSTYLCTRRDGIGYRWARWWYTDPAVPAPSTIVDFYVGGISDCRPEDWE